MAKGIKARRKGDAYQARLFWVQALKMRTGSAGDIESVAFEYDDVSFMDDVIVNYRQPVRNLVLGRDVLIDCYQCKYHMTAGGAFTVQNICDPKFLGKESGRSMIRRMYDAYVTLKARGKPFRITVASNYHWDHEDAVSDHLHEGMFRDTFFDGSDATKRGKARKALREHLGVDDQALRRFLEAVRFELGVNLSRLADEMRPLLLLAGLKPIDSEKSQIEYDDLVWNLFEQGRNVFDRDSFLDMARREKLLYQAPAPYGEVTLKSMLRLVAREPGTHHAELNLTDLFDGRHPKLDTCWTKDVPPRIKAFLFGLSVTKLPAPIHLYFDCHLSVAFAAGYLLDPKLGLHVIPTQRNPKTQQCELWKQPDTHESDVWERTLHAGAGDEMVLALSVTHPLMQHLTPSLEALKLNGLPRLELTPKGGVGHAAVASGESPWHLAHDLGKHLRASLPASCRKLHVFFAGPAAMAFILGNALHCTTPEIQLYEHDFEGGRGTHRYTCSLSLPFAC